jgi:hypothetical protein
MRRRDFIKGIAGSVAAWPVAARAQHPAKVPTIGFLGANNASFAMASIDAFVQRLRELGWIENRTVAIEYRWAEGREARFAEIAAPLHHGDRWRGGFAARGASAAAAGAGDRILAQRICLLLAQSRHSDTLDQCPLSGAQRTSTYRYETSTSDPMQTSTEPRI